MKPDRQAPRRGAPLSEPERGFVESAGELAASLSLGRSVGQLYALLYLSPEPLSMEELCARLGVSKGNASVNLRVLEDWEAVERAWVKGARAARYRARRDLRRIALKRVEEGVRRRAELARQRLSELEARRPDPAVKARLAEFKAFLDSVERGLGLLPKLGKLAGLL